MRDAMDDRPTGNDSADPTVSGAGMPVAQGSAAVPAADSRPMVPIPAGSEVPTDKMTSTDRFSSPSSNAMPVFNFLADGPRPPALDPRLAEVAKIADPHLRQQVDANVRLQTQREIAAFTDGQRQVKTQAKALIDQGGDLSSIPVKLMLQIDTPGRQ